ncbi:autotransporter domain-containing protein [Turneriella parva]|uniref:Uncharacterized protein n=1 Tax=Turneriella parva (strain ATCC BAA-1111 / DSM 21527 / NCTC 11395 / H) TaxID=869212 RepID=I4B1I6_TURPD|nr:autotransporter domain-containing protein [Turneriella parva]AFM11143.1 hypothetical protein Turpa_0488 [Turneriella parva DSM 21527]
MSKNIALIVFGLLTFTPQLFAQSLKKVMILDFKNLDKNPDYTYLEDSITEAVRNDLKAKFDFREMQRGDWHKLAEKNLFLWPEDNYTRSFGLNLGAVARQDIVVGGFYQAIIEKKASKGVRAGSYVIRAHVFVLDIGKRKVVSEFDMVMPADASLFGAVEELAARVVKEAKSVLPNKGELGQEAIEADDISPHEIGILAGISAHSVPDIFSGNFTTDKKLHNKDVPQTIGVYGTYRYHDFLWPRLAIDIAGGAQFGSTNLNVANDSKKVKADATDYSLAAHLGLRIDAWRFSFMPLAGGGFSLASLNLDYSTLSVAPVDSTGKELNSDTINTSAPFAEGGLKLGFRITQRLHLNVQGLYRQHFYIGASVGQVIATGGLTFRL